LTLQVRVLFSTPALMLLVLVMGATLTGGILPGLIATATTLAAFAGTYVLHHADAPIAYFAPGQFIDWRITLVSQSGIAVILFLAAALFRSQMVVANAGLDKARRAAIASAEAKSAFLANMSHEIRTPMNGVLGMLDVVLGGTLDPAQRKNLTVARQAAGTLLTLLDDVLDVSKLEAGGIVLDSKPCAPAALLENAATLFRPAADAKGVILEVTAPATLPQAVEVDPLRLTQIVSNLLSNAVKFTAQGTIRLDALYEDGRLLVSISDTGIGIDEDVLGEVFDRFRQAEAGTVRQFGGSGLGLSICRELVTLMGGEISASSVKGQGSRFAFAIPAPAAALPAEPEITALQPARPLSILVAEDNEVNRMVVTAFLDSLGHRHTLAADGRQAVEAAQLGAFDLVLMDVSMPVMDGFSAARAIRAQGGAGLPILALTAHVTPDIETRCKEAGMDGVLHKPITRDALAAALARHAPAAGPAAGSADLAGDAA
jgi:signal transduction histidine kinase/ActR/RegA family two-component response regulator